MSRSSAGDVAGFLSACQLDLGKKAAQLKLESREDEAAFMYIRQNVYGVYQSLYLSHKEDIGKSLAAFGHIAALWQEKRKAADIHQDHAAAAAEDVKLEAARQIVCAVSAIAAAKEKANG